MADEHELRSSAGKVTENPLQAPTTDEDCEPFPATETTDPDEIPNG